MKRFFERALLWTCRWTDGRWYRRHYEHYIHMSWDNIWFILRFRFTLGIRVKYGTPGVRFYPWWFSICRFLFLERGRIFSGFYFSDLEFSGERFLGRSNILFFPREDCFKKELGRSVFAWFFIEGFNFSRVTTLGRGCGREFFFAICFGGFRVFEGAFFGSGRFCKYFFLFSGREIFC